MTTKALLLKGFGFLVAFLWTVSVWAQCDQQQRELDYIALRALYLSTGGDNWTNNTGWPDAAFFNATPTLPNGLNMDNWYGITVNGGCVTCIDMDGIHDCAESTNWGNSLTGSIPPELGNLDNLVTLRLYHNSMSGTIPLELGNLSNLMHLNLTANNLIGDIPPELGNLNNLIELSLGINELTGNIPPELGNLSNLAYLRLRANMLVGSIPPTLGNLSNLLELDLFRNQLSGSIPPELGELNKLTELTLLWNQLSGSIPPELGNLNNLVELSLGINQLTGNIPIELGDLSNLMELYLGGNQLTGNIPIELGDLSNLSRLALFGNQLTGDIPPIIGSLSDLIFLNISNNQLTGCYDANLLLLCNQLTDPYFDGNYDISHGNSFDVSWECFCSNSTCTSLSIDLLPINPSCDDNDGSIELTVNNGLAPYTYIWSNGDDVQNPSGLNEGTYMVTISDAEVCNGIFIDSITISVPPPPTIENIEIIDALCGDDGVLTVSASGGTPPYEYSINGGAEQSENSFLDLLAGTYGIVVSDAANCTNTESITIDNLNDISLTLIPQNPDCYIDNGEISVEVNNATPPLSYAWDDGQDEATAIGLSGGLHRVTVSDANGCTVTAATSLTAPVPPVIDLGEDRETCLPPDLTLSAGYPNSTWSTGATGATLQINDFGTYSVTATDNDCTDEDEITFTQKQITLDISPSADIAISPGEYTDITLYGADDYTWSPLDGLDFNNPANVRAQPENTTTYTITATTNDGCETTATLRVRIGLLPNVFDPTSGTLSLDIDDYENNELSIYNRWGIQVFHANPYLTSNEWDGTYKGKLVPKGNYYGVLELNVSEIEPEKIRMFIVY